MKLFLVLTISFSFLFSTKTLESRIEQVSSVCESFVTGKINSLKTIEALGLNNDDYSIGINNTAKIFLHVVFIPFLFFISTIFR